MFFFSGKVLSATKTVRAAVIIIPRCIKNRKAKMRRMKKTKSPYTNLYGRILRSFKRDVGAFTRFTEILELRMI